MIYAPNIARPRENAINNKTDKIKNLYIYLYKMELRVYTLGTDSSILSNYVSFYIA